jgi:hypothetical protein
MAAMMADVTVIPSWASSWCGRELGAQPVRLVLESGGMAAVLGLELDNGVTVVLKARPVGEARRASACVEVQRALSAEGFPCARPLTALSLVDGKAVHAEEWRPGGDLERDTDVVAARRSATLFADLMSRLEHIHAEPLLPVPEWVRWDHGGPNLFPANPRHDALAERIPLPAVVTETARLARDRLSRARPAGVLGHADWEAQNMRWHGGEPRAVYDWDSLAHLPEAALVGAASGAFATAEVPTLAPVESSEAFLDAYEGARGRAFAPDEREVAWAASLWPALHNARGEVLYGVPPVALTALGAQAEARLRLAGA